MSLTCDYAKFSRLSFDIELHASQPQRMGLNLRQEGAQGIHAAGAVASGRGAGFVAHDLGNGSGGGASGLTQQRERAAQAMKGEALYSGALQCLCVVAARLWPSEARNCVPASR